MATGRNVITVGNFDGVHLGHRALVERAREVADREGAGVIAAAFDPHPASVLAPGREPPRLTTFARREALLIEAGADRVVKLEPTPDLLSLEPEAFVRLMMQTYGAVSFVEGPDFHFGRMRAGNIDVLRRLGSQLGFGVEVVEPVEAALGDCTLVRASSTIVRWLIAHGRVVDAAVVLGGPYEVEGEVVTGDRRGREIGYPTANISTPCLLPADGVYAGRAVLPGGRDVPAAVSVGTNPHFRGDRRRIEAHLLGVERDGDKIAGLPEYGWPIRLSLLGFVRDQAVFGSLEELLGQMERDCGRCLMMAEEGLPSGLCGCAHSATGVVRGEERAVRDE